MKLKKLRESIAVRASIGLGMDFLSTACFPYVIRFGG